MELLRGVPGAGRHGEMDRDFSDPPGVAAACVVVRVKVGNGEVGQDALYRGAARVL